MPAPRRVDHIDIATLPLSPADAFVLSQLDGLTDLDEIAVVTGLDEATLGATLRRLERLGAVHVERLRDPRRDDDDEPADHREERIGVETSGARPAVPPRAPVPAPPSAPRASNDDVELGPERRQAIDAMFERLDVASHYALLGVKRDADKKTIKNAYYELIPQYHPDKFFGRSLGDYKKKLEKIFDRLTEAESVLTRKSRRDEYDRYLESRRETRAFNAVLTSIPPPPISRPPPAESAPAPAPSPPPAPPVVDPVEAAEQRSRALARRLANLKPAVRTPEPPAPTSASDSRDRAGESMKRFLASRRSPRIDTFVKAGQEAMASESWVSAVNALRIALNMAPEDTAISALYEEANTQAQRHLARSYEASARYEEKNGHWEKAASSWERVAEGRPEDALPLQRAAECLLHGDDPRRALKAARDAVRLAPDALEYRMTLVRAYEAAELVASALGELTRLLEKDPDNAELAAWRKRLEKR